MAILNIQQILFKRGNTTAASAYIGPLGEPLLDTGLKTLRIQDGVTRGGWLVASNAQVWSLSNSISTMTGIDTTFLANINTLLANASTQQISLNTINANLGAFGTYANATFGTSSYGNANVALYLQDHPQGGTTYSNSNVASYLISNPQSGTYSNSNVESFIGGNVGSYQIYANANAATQATGINSINANIGVFQTYANNTFSTGTYSNSNVESYIGANIGSLWANAGVQATSISTIDANTAAANTAIQSLSANIGSLIINAPGALDTLAEIDAALGNNASFSSVMVTWLGNITSNVTSANTNITALQGNLGAFETYANLTFSTSTYSNSNVTSYLIANPQSGTYSNSNVESYIGANVGSLWSNAAAQATSLNTITANLGAYQTYANANAATQAGSITTLQTQVYANANVAAYLPTYTGNIAGNIVKNGYAWTFGTDGALTLPADAGQIGISGYTNGIDLYNNSGGTGYVRMNYADESFVWTDSGGSHIQTTGGTWDFGTDANLTLPATGYLRVGTGIVAGFASSPAPIISGFSSISAENFKFQGNGVNILSTVTGSYGNTNVAAYLVANPQAGTYSNVNVQAYLGANVGAYQTYANANLGTATTNISNLQANVGSYQIYANANIGTIYNSVTTNTTWLGNLQANVYSNANVIANLQNLTTNVTTTANVTAGNLVSTGNLYVNDGYIRTQSTTGNIFNSGVTTVNFAGGATGAVNIGNASGLINLNGNVQGSTNGSTIGYMDIPQNATNNNYVLALADRGKHVYSTSATNQTVYIPTNANVAFPVGSAVNMVLQGTGNIFITANSGVTMYLAGNSTASSTRTMTSYGMGTIQKVATDTWFVVGVGIS